MKYKIIQDNLRFGKDGEILSDTEAELLNIPILLEKGFIEEVKEGGKRWRAEDKAEYFIVNSYGEITNCIERYLSEDDYRYLIGNYFQTKEQAQQKKDKDLAIARVNNRIRELQGGEMSMEEMMDSIKPKYYIHYVESNKEYDYFTWSNYHQSIFLSIRTWKIAQQIIKEHKSDLDIIWGIKE